MKGYNKPREWSKRTWLDGIISWQFRTFDSPRRFQVCFNVDDFQGEGLLSCSVHVLNKALAFECPMKVTKEVHWKLVK